MTIGARIRALRLAAGQTVEDVARGTRMHAGLIVSIEAGRPVTEMQIGALSRWFGVEEGEIAGERVG